MGRAAQRGRSTCLGASERRRVSAGAAAATAGTATGRVEETFPVLLEFGFEI